MHRVGGLIVFLALSAAPFPGTSTSQGQDHVERKAIEKVAPVYPELAKRMHVAGVVKLEVVVRANGNVKSTRVVGGNPVLIQSATDAVRKWKFEAASDETTGIVELTFEPR
jgi:TonB family protein